LVHVELEFIHPFIDGLPIEEVVRDQAISPHS
jgi:hypothetical protein